MAIYSKKLLSSSVNGKNIQITATASTGTNIHTAITGTTSMDEIWLYAVNTYGAPVKLTVEWGATTSPASTIVQSIPLQSGLVLIIPGLILNNGLSITAYADTTNVINIQGYVNRIV